MSHFGTFKPSTLERLFGRALTGLLSEAQRLQRRRLGPEPSEAEAAAEALSEARLVQVVLGMVWSEMEAGCTEAAVGIVQVRGCCLGCWVGDRVEGGASL